MRKRLAYKPACCHKVQRVRYSDTTMNLSRLLQICKTTAVAWVDDHAPSMGAAISYYTVFSIAPLLVIVIAIAGYVFGDEAVRGALQGQISGLVGEEGAIAIQGLIRSAREPAEGLIASGISIVFLVVGATTVFAEIQSALDRIWHVPEKAKPSGLWGLLRARFLSFGLILALAFLLIASLSLSAGVAAIGTYFSSLMPGWEVLLQGLNMGLSLVVETVLFAMIFKLMPSTRIAWSDVWVGAAVTAALFELGKVLIGLYVGKAGISSTYAAAGSIAIILIWVYYAAQIFLLGAEFTKVYATECGSYRSDVTAQVSEPKGMKEDQAPGDAATEILPATIAASLAGTPQRDSGSAKSEDSALVAGVALVVALGGLFAVRAAVVSWFEQRKKSRLARRNSRSRSPQ